MLKPTVIASVGAVGFSPGNQKRLMARSTAQIGSSGPSDMSILSSVQYFEWIDERICAVFSNGRNNLSVRAFLSPIKQIRAIK
ncbi:hypothetical protein [Sinimarinibacterium sp. NLF-5-8]|uniref:hypothetical protein n=1 Tax=Sinimarinibacterium sp. NLF-5-8 TaxID=2698684 RepID=UPI00137BD2B2|nr:hypothetical protein [Sinimarinibacterium sp. NLF-5-8]QHS09371.1 hypothetical protein GT972_03845 [Sinimarinibacterium sp. NLF-5-8]